MSKNFNELYLEKLNEQKESVNCSLLKEQLQIKKITNNKLEEITSAMQEVTNKKVYEDFYFKSGKILGILRFIGQNPVYKNELLEITGLSQAHIDIYFDICGNLPYYDKENNVINEGRPMDCEATKEFLKIVASDLGIFIEDIELDDIYEDRWNKLYENAMAKAIANKDKNPEIGEEEVFYEE